MGQVQAAPATTCKKYKEIAVHMVKVQINCLNALQEYPGHPSDIPVIIKQYEQFIRIVLDNELTNAALVLSNMDIKDLEKFDPGDVVARSLARQIKTTHNTIRQNLMDNLVKVCTKKEVEKMLHPECSYCQHVQNTSSAFREENVNCESRANVRMRRETGSPTLFDVEKAAKVDKLHSVHTNFEANAAKCMFPEMKLMSLQDMNAAMDPRQVDRQRNAPLKDPHTYAKSLTTTPFQKKKKETRPMSPEKFNHILRNGSTAEEHREHQEALRARMVDPDWENYDQQDMKDLEDYDAFDEYGNAI